MFLPLWTTSFDDLNIELKIIVDIFMHKTNNTLVLVLMQNYNIKTPPTWFQDAYQSLNNFISNTTIKHVFYALNIMINVIDMVKLLVWKD